MCLRREAGAKIWDSVPRRPSRTPRLINNEGIWQHKTSHCSLKQSECEDAALRGIFIYFQLMIYLQEYVSFHFHCLLGNLFANWATDDEELYKVSLKFVKKNTNICFKQRTLHRRPAVKVQRIIQGELVIISLHWMKVEPNVRSKTLIHWSLWGRFSSEVRVRLRVVIPNARNTNKFKQTESTSSVFTCFYMYWIHLKVLLNDCAVCVD